MTTTRRATDFIRTNVSVLLGLAAVWLVCGFLLMRHGRDGLGGPTGLVWVTLAVAGLGLGFIAVRYQRFRCPQCGGPCETREERFSSDPLIKHCRACDIDWRLGRR